MIIDKPQITIVYAADENFIPQTYVSIFSILKSRSRDYFIDFIILMPKGSQDNVVPFKCSEKNFSIKIIDVDDSIFDCVGGKIEHITNPTFYRLLIPLLEDIGDKCLYLDGDTICCSDIIELYETNIEDYCVAGCRQTRPPFDETSANACMRELGIPCVDDYINAGVLLFNVQKMREMNVDMVKESLSNYSGQDQHVINKCWYGFIKILHPRYNLYSWAENLIKNDIPVRYPMNLMKEAINSPCIIHYACLYTKPWINSKATMGELWWVNAQKALDKEMYDKMEHLLLENEGKYGEHADKLYEARNIYVFGSGKDGVNFIEYARNNNLYNKLVCFIDNDKDKANAIIEGLCVNTPDKIQDISEDDCIVVASSKYRGEITSQLKIMKVPSNQIYTYRHKNWEYYMSFEVW